MTQEREAVACAERIVERTYNFGELEREAKIVAKAFLALRSGGEGWRPINDVPSRPMGVLLFMPDEAHDETIAGQDYRIQVGWWSGLAWCEQGTGHDYRELSEAWGGDGQGCPVAWKPLDAPSPSTHGEG